MNVFLSLISVKSLVADKSSIGQNFLIFLDMSEVVLNIHFCTFFPFSDDSSAYSLKFVIQISKKLGTVDILTCRGFTDPTHFMEPF